MIDDVKTIVIDSLQLNYDIQQFDGNTPLLGAIPEFDSMAVVTLITAIEERFGIFVADDEISADTFSTIGSLASFVESKTTS